MKLIFIALFLVISNQMTIKSHLQASPFAGKIFSVAKIIREVPDAVGTIIQFAPAGQQPSYALNFKFIHYTVGEDNSFSTSDQTWEGQSAERNNRGDYIFLIEYLLSISHHYTYEDGVVAFSIQANETTLIELKQLTPYTP